MAMALAAVTGCDEEECRFDVDPNVVLNENESCGKAYVNCGRTLHKKAQPPA